MATALAVAIIIGLVLFLPSGVLNLRAQEGIFPVVAVGYMVGMALTACFFFTFQIGRLLFLAVLYAAMVQSAYLDRSQQGDS